ncbi:MAG: hypothetical protein M1828_002228 [Chrysothrix sp. TS-e1954]|nr:MAG: hypothetical protein M1828_002228 [Chrysothrix sp. TS-e1954]
MDKQQILWAEIVAAKRKLAAKKKVEKMLSVNDFATFQKNLDVLRAKYSTSIVSSQLNTLSPAFERLRAFSSAISAFIQSDPTYSGLVWGGVLIVLECATRFSSILCRITTMIDSMTKAMPRFEEYVKLYPESAALQSALRDIYSTHTDFCLHAYQFFRHRPLYRVVSMTWSKMSHLFDSTIEEIRKKTLEFEAEATLAHRKVGAQHRAKLEDALPWLGKGVSIPEQRFSVPFQRNSKFYGREEALNKLCTNLQTPDQQNSCAVVGTGGLGKTQLAVEYCYRASKHAGAYDYVFWIQAQNEGMLTDTFSAIAQHLNLTPYASNDTLLQIDMARRWLCVQTGWLLVFDNVDDVRLLNRYWPTCNHGAILLTSQISEAAHRTSHAISLPALTSHEGSSLLISMIIQVDNRHKQGLSRDAVVEAQKISKEVDGMPLLLVGLAGCITQSQRSLEEVLQILSKSSRADARRMMANESMTLTTFQYGRPMRTVYDLVLRALSQRARDFLNILAMLSPDMIPETLFMTNAKGSMLSYAQCSGRDQFIDDIRLPLAQRNIVSLRPSEHNEHEYYYSIHRSLQRTVLEDLDGDVTMRQAVFEQTVAVLQYHLPRPSPIMVPLSEKWPMYVSIVPHVISLHHVYVTSVPGIRGTLPFAELLCNVGTYLYEKGFGRAGLPVLETAATICGDFLIMPEEEVQDQLRVLSSLPRKESQANNASLTAYTLQSLEANILAYAAGIHWVAGGISTRKQAHEWTVKVVELREAHVGRVPATSLQAADLLLLANSYSDLAFQLLDEEKYEDAEEWLGKSLRIKEACHEQEALPQFEFAVSLQSLSFVRLAQGRLDEAVELTRDVVAKMVEGEGHRNASTQTFRFLCAVVEHNVGSLQRSLEIHQDVLKFRRDLLGEFSQNTLHSSFAVGQILWELGDIEGAEKAIRLCIDNADDTQWPKECKLRASYQLSLILESVGGHAGVDKMKESAIQESKRLINDHTELNEPVTGRESHMKLFDSLVNHQAGRSTISS